MSKGVAGVTLIKGMASTSTEARVTACGVVAAEGKLVKPFTVGDVCDVLAGDAEELVEEGEVSEPRGVLLGDPLGEPLGVEEEGTNARVEFPFPRIFLFGPLVESRFKSCSCVVDILKDIVFLILVEAE